MKFAKYWDKSSWPKSIGTINDNESLTDQSFKSMCEIEQLLVNSRATPRTPVYDMENYETSNWTFEDWHNEKAKIERKFIHLDDETRTMFGNAQNFFKYCSNPENYIIEDGKLKDAPPPVDIVPPVTVTPSEISDGGAQ